MTIPNLTAAFEALQNGELARAQEFLGDSATGPASCEPPSEWWRLQAMVQLAAGRDAAAERSFQEGFESLRTGQQQGAGRFYYTYGSYLINHERPFEALKAFVQCRRKAMVDGDLMARLGVAYNLAWAHLQVGNVAQASVVLDKELPAIERPSGQNFRALVHCGRSLVALVQGDSQLSLARAQIAERCAPTLDMKARALYLQGIASAVLGQSAQGKVLLQRSLATYSGGDLGRRTVSMMALWERRLPDVRTRDEQARVDLYAAFWALEDGDTHTAGRLLARGVQAATAFTRIQLSLLLPELRTWSQGTASAMPVLPQPPRVIQIGVRNRLPLLVNGHEVHTRVPASIPAVVATLVLAGGPEGYALPAKRIAREALGNAEKSLDRVLARLRILIGDQEVVQEYQVGQVPWVKLSDRWTWLIDDEGSGRVMRGLSSETAELYV